jgi:hypothetical protein
VIHNLTANIGQFESIVTALFISFFEGRMFSHWIVKVKSRPATRHGGAWGERMYSSYSFTTSALDGDEWSASRPGRALPPGKGPPVPIGEEAGWASHWIVTNITSARGTLHSRKTTIPCGDQLMVCGLYLQ